MPKMLSPAKEAILTVEETADLLKLTPTQVRRLARDGKLPHQRFTNKILRFVRDEVLAAQKREVTE